MPNFKKTISVEIQVTQAREFSSDHELHLWIASCLNCNVNNRKVSISVIENGMMAAAPELYRSLYKDCQLWLDDELDDGDFGDRLRLTIARIKGGAA